MNRQLVTLAVNWAVRAFGKEHVFDPRARALRLLEEAAEFAQSVGVHEQTAQRCITVVYSRPPGETNQELGGVFMTAVVAAAAINRDPEAVFLEELDRVLSKPVEHFTQRNIEKNKLGLK